MTVLWAPAWERIGIGLDVTAAGALFSVMLSLWPRRDRLGGAGPAVLSAMALSGVWCLAEAVMGGGAVRSAFPSVLETARNLAWFFAIYRLFGADGRKESVAPIRPVVLSLCFVEALHFILDILTPQGGMLPGIARVAVEANVILRLLATVGGLVLVHNLYVGADRDGRRLLRWPAIGLAALWIFELNLYTVAYLAGEWPEKIAALRALASLILAGCMGLAAARDGDSLRLSPSRTVAFQTFSLLAIGIYLVVMVMVAQWLSYAGGNVARLVELTFLTLAAGFALVVLPSARLRGWMRVTIVKHFFQHRYDYREEWLRFARTMGNDAAGALPLGERVVQAVAEVFDSPQGLLLVADDHGDLVLAARRGWPDLDVPAIAAGHAFAGFFERTGYIAELDDLRSGPRGEIAQAVELPDWMAAQGDIWAAVPLVHYERLMGLVLLGRPVTARRLDWEDFDLLRVMGQQAGAFLAEKASQEALAEASRFDEFNRRMAFVMHDIKNLASQFSLLARNAELHADKKAFRDDMVLTLRSSSEKLNALMVRLSRYGSAGADRLSPLSGAAVLDTVAERFRTRGGVLVTCPCDVVILANAHSLEQVLVHLVQNAIDASAPNASVSLTLSSEGLGARIDVIDSGCGMSSEFVRNRLFRPFVSTKSGGFGIGAFEARELVRAMNGRLDVESREGLGSRFTVRLPVATGSADDALGADPSGETACNDEKVA